MSITDVHTASGQNTYVLSKPSIHKYCKSPQAIHNYCEPSQMKPAAILQGWGIIVDTTDQLEG